MTFNSGEVDIDFAKIYGIANEILATSAVIEEFPFKFSKLIKEQTDIRLCSYAKALNKYNVPVKELGSGSAELTEMYGAYIIFYNNEEPEYRIRFSIGHELGHYLLDHKMNLSKDDPLYQKQETEANCFAAQLVMPEQILRQASKRGKMINIDFIMKSFDVSEKAAIKRRKTLAKYDYEWKKRAEKEYDDIILMRFAPFINKIAPIKTNSYYDYDYEESRQRERNSWLDTRTRWN